ncbi:4-hydroxybenzoate octaprenyltransferase [Gammaproteobacteria bacterium]
MLDISFSTVTRLARDRLYQYWLLTRFHRPIGIFLLLWPMLWALWIAGEGQPRPFIVMVFVLGTALMRAAGCAINDYADRDFDPFVRRTRERPLASGRVSPKEALGVFMVLSLLSFLLVLSMNALTIKLSVVGALLAASYPFMKRYTHLPQFYLGVAFGWAVPMAFAAQTGALPPVAWIIFAATVLWAVAYDTLYAMVDREDDLKIGVKSTAILFGRYDRLAVGIAQGAVLFLLMVTGFEAERGIVYFLGLITAAGFFVHQQWLARNRDPSLCFRAFLNNHWFGLAIFIGLVLDYRHFL